MSDTVKKDETSAKPDEKPVKFHPGGLTQAKPTEPTEPTEPAEAEPEGTGEPGDEAKPEITEPEPTAPEPEPKT